MNTNHCPKMPFHCPVLFILLLARSLFLCSTQTESSMKSRLCLLIISTSSPLSNAWYTASVYLTTSSLLPVIPLLSSIFSQCLLMRWALQAASVAKNPSPSAEAIRDVGLIPGSGRSPGGRNGNSLQCLCLESPMDREAWQRSHGVTKSQRRLRWLGIYEVILVSLKDMSASINPTL